MKIAVVIFSSLLALTSASFFSELASSISSVQTGIEKLLSDATVDLKDTIDCSVYAVQQAFSGDGIVQGYQKCQENNNNITLLSPSKPVHADITSSVTPTPADHSRMIKPTPEARDTKNNDQVEKKNFESYLSGFVNMNSKLEHEFEDLSKHVNDDLIKIENAQKQLPIENVVNEIDKLLEKEIIFKNSTDNEIHEVYDKILTKLDENNSDKFDLKDEIKSILTELEQHKNQSQMEQELQKWKKKELESLDDIRNMLKKQQKLDMDTIKQDGTSTNMSNTMETIKKETVTEFFKSARTNTKTVSAPITVSSTRATIPDRTTTPDLNTANHLVRTTTQTPYAFVHRTTKTTKPSYMKPDDYVTSDKSTIDLALKLVSESKKTASIMANILKRRKSSVFDGPELLTGKGR